MFVCVCPQLLPGLPQVNISGRIQAYRREPQRISCSAHSELPFRLQLSRAGARLGEEKQFRSVSSLAQFAPCWTHTEAAQPPRCCWWVDAVCHPRLPVCKHPEGVAENPKGCGRVMPSSDGRNPKGFGAAGSMAFPAPVPGMGLIPWFLSFHRGSGNSSWLIPVVSKSDEGFYECTATSKVGVTRARAYVSVSGACCSCRALVPGVPQVQAPSSPARCLCRATTASPGSGQRHGFAGPRRGAVLPRAERCALQPDVELGREGGPAGGRQGQAAAEPLAGDQPRAAGGRGPLRVHRPQCPRHRHRLRLALRPG